MVARWGSYEVRTRAGSAALGGSPATTAGPTNTSPSIATAPIPKAPQANPCVETVRPSRGRRAPLPEAVLLVQGLAADRERAVLGGSHASGTLFQAPSRYFSFRPSLRITSARYSAFDIPAGFDVAACATPLTAARTTIAARTVAILCVLLETSCLLLFSAAASCGLCRPDHERLKEGLPGPKGLLKEALNEHRVSDPRLARGGREWPADRARRLETASSPWTAATACQSGGLAGPADRRALERVAARHRLDGPPGLRLPAPEGGRPRRDRHASARLPRPRRARCLDLERFQQLVAGLTRSPTPKAPPRCCRRRWVCGAARHSPTLTTRSPARNAHSSRNSGPRRSSSGSTPTSSSAATPSSYPSWRRSSARNRCESGAAPN